jgi:hypothetical protein
MDMKLRYHQIGMKTSNIHKTAFTTYFGHYEYLCMSFGLTNALTTIHALMNSIFGKKILAFFDDILVFISNLCGLFGLMDVKKDQ